MKLSPDTVRTVVVHSATKPFRQRFHGQQRTFASARFHSHLGVPNCHAAARVSCCGKNIKNYNKRKIGNTQTQWRRQGRHDYCMHILSPPSRLLGGKSRLNMEDAAPSWRNPTSSLDPIRGKFCRTTDEVMPAGIQIEIDSLVRLNRPVHSVEHLTWIA